MSDDEDDGNKALWAALAAWLILRHSREQDKIADTVRDGVIRAFPTLNFHNLDGTQLPWVEATLPHVRTGFESSQKATISFLEDYRKLRMQESGLKVQPRPKIVTVTEARSGNRPLGEPRTKLAREFNERKAAAALLATGPGRIKQAMPAPKPDAMAKGLKGAAGAAIRQAMNGGREVSEDEAEEDAIVTAFQRVTDANPCFFCALLAANGPISKRTIYMNNRAWNANRQTGEKFVPNAAHVLTGDPKGIARAHDHCRCTLVPVYNDRFHVQETAMQASKLWREASEGRSPQEGLKEYRRRYESSRRKPPDEAIDTAALRKALSASGDANLRSWASALTA